MLKKAKILKMNNPIPQVYESEKFNHALDESLHPGGTDISERAAELAQIGKGTTILDIASARGKTACYLAKEFDSFVYGIDLSANSVAQAKERAIRLELSDQVKFQVADALKLPFKDNYFDTVFGECSFSLLSDKIKGAAEIARVLKPGGKLAFNDVFLRNSLSTDLKGNIPFECCFSQADTLDGYLNSFRRVNMENTLFEDHSLSMFEITLQLQSEYGSLAAFWEQFGRSSSEGCSCCSDSIIKDQGYGKIWRRLFAEADPGYCLMLFTKK